MELTSTGAAEQVVAALSAITCPVQRAVAARQIGRSLRVAIKATLVGAAREARDAEGVGQLAGALGVTPQYVYQLIGGRAAMSDPARDNAGQPGSDRGPHTATPGVAA